MRAILALKAAAIAAALLAAAGGLAPAQAQAAPAAPPAAGPTAAGARNVVIVPGSFVDGSGWRVVFDILYHAGYHVTIANQPHTSFDDDVAAAREVLDQQVGPVVLVGHSSGGAIISAAGARDKVKALVYVSALLPDVGESLAQVLGSMPAPSNSVQATQDGHLFFDRARFHADFGADLAENRTNFMAAAQVPATTSAFTTQIWAAAWRSKPSYAIVATDDRALSPDLQRWMYQRAGATVTEIKASHLVYISQPEKVADVILTAAHNAH
ncbi:pimeloyl-ACP methyl ester carboxylesterase [Duganella sp. SG902]|uniref:alpha/beta fold hydrolase n=1 Tax=Duganella sp. SG902 TaxID=2587016 RepID=UPI00159DCC58|nr:alpha/beta hydrolase [Duganella sp. SG902]NVM75555.1 pimeloyl-ACP methyl ester carboxylesterase [Duganella sp. SG902]